MTDKTARKRYIQLRVSESELTDLKQRASAVKLNLSEYLRRCGLSKRLPYAKFSHCVDREHLSFLTATVSKFQALAPTDDKESLIRVAEEMAIRVRNLIGSLYR